MRIAISVRALQKNYIPIVDLRIIIHWDKADFTGFNNLSFFEYSKFVQFQALLRACFFVLLSLFSPPFLHALLSALYIFHVAAFSSLRANVATTFRGSFGSSGTAG